jgi:hypothetical protein
MEDGMTHGTAFPPASSVDVFFYSDDEIVAGYRDYRPRDPEPGANRSPGYRWGWSNARYDRTGQDGGLASIRAEVAKGPLAESGMSA